MKETNSNKAQGPGEFLISSASGWTHKFLSV